jgi:hypothetical protein
MNKRRKVCKILMEYFGARLLLCNSHRQERFIRVTYYGTRILINFLFLIVTDLDLRASLVLIPAVLLHDPTLRRKAIMKQHTDGYIYSLVYNHTVIKHLSTNLAEQ